MNEVFKSDIIDKLLKISLTDNYSVKKESVYALCNATVTRNYHLIDILVKRDMFTIIINFFNET